jgi:hypothetical protein
MLSAYATARRPNGMPAMPASTRPSQDLAKADTGKSRRA